ncbi:MAG: hypothetical protein R2822_11690 [Spirosomataceae bacterium]
MFYLQHQESAVRPILGQAFTWVNIPVKLIAKAKAGYKFKHWLYNSTQLTDSIQVVNSDSSMTYIAVFESAVLSENPIPNAAMLNACGYEFVSWPSTSAAGTSPNHLKFVYMEDSDPGLNSAIAGFTTGVYNLTSATRIKGLGTNGVSFINTGSGNTGYPGTKLGGVLLALNTENKSDIKVKWTGRTLAIGAREYGIRLQYRIGDIVNFIDLLNEMNQVVDYSRGAANDSTLFEVKLPNILNQPYIQLLWRYYHKAGTSGNRDELGLDNIFIETKRI